MNSNEPKLALSEDALVLIRHAVAYLHDPKGSPAPVGRIPPRTIVGSTTPRQWSEEAAVLRLISIVEAYVDALYANVMQVRLIQPRPLITAIVEYLERTSSKAWRDRHETFTDLVGFSLTARSGWQEIGAGIEVRNCLAHGLGTLTAIQRPRTKLAQQVRILDVQIHSNRMHLSSTTVGKLGGGCIKFVREVDELAASLIS